ncbi:MAG TPA: TIGR01212 family radical SAM protein [Tenuifilaceae bacterium]|nr:TIGR01212 family radical SAM protein [Tenuifilaceae bacterium]HPI44515.1 TIGR01212 family radical SAM protein [Tenuifilaceae bacterium]HPN22164.1 TIGR01212 family radical SAM protein [Tenuifilaceae bacterium]
MSYPWGDNRRFNSYSNYFKREFGGRVQKLTIDAGFTCPNRDGTVATGGCTYCNNDAFNPSYCTPSKSITQQIDEGIEFHAVRYRRADRYLAYFQAFSNTHAPLDKLEKLYSEALSNPKIIGLVIGTRPDCVDEQKLDYFQELSKKYYIALEYGVESCYNKTLEMINRGHNFEKSVWAIEETHKRGIKTGAHIIFGLPGESRDEMMAEAAILSKLPLSTIKFHQLQIIKGTAMELQYQQNPSMFNLFGMEEYFNFMVDFLEQLNPTFVVERFTGEAPPRYLATPPWGNYRTDQLMVMLEKILEQRNTWQGRLFS